MDKQKLVEFANITKELDELLVKFDELNKKTEDIKLNKENKDASEVETLLNSLELQYEVLDRKMKQLSVKSEKLKNTISKK